MDKLKQILTYRFWILLGLAAIIPLVGWAVGRSGLIAEAAQRTDELTKLRDKLKTTSEDPNADWEKKLAAINQVQKAELRRAWQALYERQEKLMTWPTPVDPVKLDTEAGRIRQVQLYRTRYAPALEVVRQIVKPLDEYQNGLVDLSDSILPHPEAEWITQPPGPKDIFAAQEDLWLLEGILKAIAEVNEGSTSQLDAPVRQIVELLLRGGSVKGAAAPTTTTTTPGEGDGQMDLAAMMRGRRRGDGGDDMGAPMGMTGGPSAGAAFNNDVTFNPDDEFGPEVPAVDPNQPAEGTAAAGVRLPAGFGARAVMDRYIENKPEWKTRGFYLEVVMDHRNVPDLLVALSNASWPIRITRVHQADFKDEDLVQESSVGPQAGLPFGGRGGGDGEDGNAMRRAFMMRNMMNQGGGGQPAGGRIRGSRRAAATVIPGGNPALEDHNLANVALDGFITIYKQPPNEPVPAVSPMPTTPGPTGQPVAAPVADVTAAAEKPAAEETAAEVDDKAVEEAAPEKAETTP